MQPARVKVESRAHHASRALYQFLAPNGFWKKEKPFNRFAFSPLVSHLSRELFIWRAASLQN
jgi:hypothetical protein